MNGTNKEKGHDAMDSFTFCITTAIQIWHPLSILREKKELNRKREQEKNWKESREVRKTSRVKETLFALECIEDEESCERFFECVACIYEGSSYLK